MRRCGPLVGQLRAAACATAGLPAGAPDDRLVAAFWDDRICGAAAAEVTASERCATLLCSAVREGRLALDRLSPMAEAAVEEPVATGIVLARLPRLTGTAAVDPTASKILVSRLLAHHRDGCGEGVHGG